MSKPQLSQLTSDEQRLLKEIRERIRPSHWFTLTSSSPREVGALVDRAGGALNRLAKQFPGLRYVVIGSDNRGQSSPHLHGILFLPIESEPFLLKLSEAWGWGDVIEVKALDPAGGATAYVIRQTIEGEILWSDGEAPQLPGDSSKNSNPEGASLRPSKERRLFLKDLARIEAHDRLKRELRRERERQRQRIAAVERQLVPQRTGGRIIRRRLHWMQRKALEPSPIEVTVPLQGVRAL